MLKKTGLATVLALALVGGTARADTITIFGDMVNSSDHVGNYEATLTYTPTDATHGTFTVAITNTTSPASYGGYITAIVFNNPSDRITGAILASSTNTNFALIGGPTFDNSIHGGPFGQYDIGASTGGSFEGGGKPSQGIAIGGTNTFVFSFTGTSLDTLGADDFLSTLSVPPANEGGVEFFVARFRGFTELAPSPSDKVPGLHHSPEPPTLLLGGFGLFLGGAIPVWRRLRRTWRRLTTLRFV